MSCSWLTGITTYLHALHKRYLTCVLDLQACSGLLDLMRQNSASGAAFCKLLVTQLEDQASTLDMGGLLQLNNVLMAYLMECKIVRAKKTRAKKAAGQGMAHSNLLTSQHSL